MLGLSFFKFFPTLQAGLGKQTDLWHSLEHNLLPIVRGADEIRKTLALPCHLRMENVAISIADHAEADVEHLVIGSVIHPAARRAALGAIIE